MSFARHPPQALSSNYAIVRFPMVGPDGASLADVSVEFIKTAIENRICLAPGVPQAHEILLDARTNEPEVSRFAAVQVRLSSREVSGNSFGLALALADKLSRANIPVTRTLIATGEVVGHGRGRLKGIADFSAKFDLVLGISETTPVLFACPLENVLSLDVDRRARLDGRIAEGFLVLFAAHSVNEIWDALVRLHVPPASPNKTRLWLYRGGGILLTIALAGIAYGKLDQWTCMASAAVADRWPSTKVMSFGSRICVTAAAAHPDIARLQFVAGQFQAVRGNMEAATGFWRRSAQLGDVDGMAVWGRHRWLSAPADPRVVTDAMVWLTRAAEQRNEAAMESLAAIALDDRAFPRDERTAERWLQEARAVRRESR